jgi:hypothetical protein
MAACMTAYLGGSYTQSSSACREIQFEHGAARSQRCFLPLQGRHETMDRARVAFVGVSETSVSFVITFITAIENFGDRAVEGRKR